MSHNEQYEWLWTARVWLLILKSALYEENDKNLAQAAVNEVANILSEISYIRNLWDGEISSMVLLYLEL